MTVSALLPLLLPLFGLPLGGPASPQERGVISKVEFEGNRRIPDALLLSKIRTRPGEPFAERVLDEDVKRLTTLGKFLPISAEWKEDPENPNWIEVTFRVRDREEVRWVRFRGREGISRDDLEDLLQTQKGALLSDYFTRMDRESIQEKYLQEGYLFADVTHEVRALSSGVGVRFVIEEGPRVKVRQIVFEGNDHIDASDLEQQMQTKERAWWGILEPGIYREELFQEDLELVRRFCRSRGYLDARISLHAVEFSEDREWMTLKIRIREGEKYVVSQVLFSEIRYDERGRQATLEGIEGGPYSEAFLRGRLSIKEGEPFQGERIQQDVETIQRVYQKASYMRVAVRTRVEPEETGPRVKVIFGVHTGPETKVGKIIIRGNHKTQSKVIRREMGFYPGDLFDIDVIEESYSRLLRRQYYKSVQLRLDPSTLDSEASNVLVEVEEARTGSLIVGGGIASTVGFFGNFQLLQRNFDISKVPTSWRDLREGNFFQGGGQTLRLVAQPGRQRSFYRASFSEPYFLDLPLQLGLDLFWRERDRFDYTEGRWGGSVTLGHQLTPNSDVQLRYRREDIFITDIDQDAASDVLRVEGKSRLASLALAYGLDTRRLDPQMVVYDGGRLNGSYEWASRHLGGGINLNRFRGDAEYHFHLFEIPDWGKFVLRAWIGGGWVGEAGGSDDVPIFERFFLGGPPKLRGFEFREIGPSESSRPIGGKVMTVEGFELQFPILQGIFRGVFFLDTGNLAEDYQRFTLKEHRVSAGVGIRIKVPIFPAPVELDFGYPLRKEPEDERRTFSFFIGFPF